MDNQIVLIKAFPIRLGQFLKLSCAVQDGIEAKILIQNGDVMVNGQVERRRGKQLFRGDNVQVGADQIFIVEKT